MKQIFFFFLLVFSISVHTMAQNVAVNNTGAAPHASAILDVSSPSKGLLIPRISLTGLTDATTVPGPSNGLLIYNTNAAVTGGVGFYYNSGTTNSVAWLKLMTSTDIIWNQQPDFVELVPAKPLYVGTRLGLGIEYPTESLQVVDGDVKIGNAVWSAGNDRVLKFGDNDYVKIGEVGEDDVMQLSGKYFWFKGSGGYSGNVGIGTLATPTAKLEVNGSFKLTDGSQGNGKILSSDAQGNASWKTVPGSSNFRTISSGAQIFSPNAYNSFSGFIEDYDVSNNCLGGVFIAPAQGVYHIDAKIDVSIVVANLPNYSRIYLEVYKNGVSITQTIEHIANNTTNTYIQTISVNEDMQLLPNDQLSLRIYAQAQLGSGVYSVEKVSFSGFRTY